jgi:hypothetical protein
VNCFSGHAEPCEMFIRNGNTCTVSLRLICECLLVSIADVRTGADKSLALPIFLFSAQPKEFFLDGLKKLEQRSHKCVDLRGEYVE